jgi:hypothetical protein
VEETKLDFYKRVLEEGTHFISKKDGRYRVCYNDQYFTRATLVYHLANPSEGPLQKGEEIHHRDHNRLNDGPTNLERLTQRKHLAVHSGKRIVSRKRSPKERSWLADLWSTMGSTLINTGVKATPPR